MQSGRDKSARGTSFKKHAIFIYKKIILLASFLVLEICSHTYLLNFY